jgi:replicative DNA helicase
MKSSHIAALERLRVPPQAVEAEASVLGALLLDNTAFDNVADIVAVDDFYRHQNQTIFKAISELIRAARPADVITVFERLQSLGKAESADGIQYLNDLAQYVPSANNVRRYAELVRDRSILRKLVKAGDDIADSAFDSHGLTPAEVLEQAERHILSIREQGVAGREAKGVDYQINRFLTQLQERADSPDQRNGVQTGFAELDNATDGFQAGDLVVIAGRPSMGKTAMAMNIAEHCAIEQRLPVLVFSLEMSADQLTQRMVGSIGRIDQKRLKRGTLNDHEWSQVSEAVEVFRGATLDIQDTGVETISGVRSAARRAARQHKALGLIVVDYLQLLNGNTGDKSSAESRATEVAQISRGLKLLAKEMQCPVIALSQLNRSVESRPDKRPLMSDLRESGAIEQDADTIMFVYRDEVYTKDACEQPGVAEIIIGKQRNGPTGVVKLSWSPNHTRFNSRSGQR